MDNATNDSEIRARLAAGDSTALDMIWTLYADDLLGYLVSMLRSRHDAEDVLQDCFVTIARKRATVARARLLKPYLFRLAASLAVAVGMSFLADRSTDVVNTHARDSGPLAGHEAIPVSGSGSPGMRRLAEAAMLVTDEDVVERIQRRIELTRDLLRNGADFNG